jgi:phosphohistidine phosphatase SixA
MVKATGKRIFLTRHAQAEHKCTPIPVLSITNTDRSTMISVAEDYSSAISFEHSNSWIKQINAVPDAPLTALGREQAQQLNENTKYSIQQTAELLVTSPMRRALSSMTIGYSE